MPFSSKATIEGTNLSAFLFWAHNSFEWEKGDPPDQGVLALPPIQRNAAWNPRQVVDVWDSVFRGLPLGAFMLQCRPGGQLARAPNANNELLPAGWDLLDGQQRVRSLLLGLYGPDPSRDKRCLWINLDQPPDRYLFDLHLTSGSQPFGYDANGYKPPASVRETARNRFEPPPVRGDEESAMWEIKVGDRRAYNHELFGGFIVGEPRLRLASGAKSLPMPPETYPGGWPPPPMGVKLTSAPTTPEANGLIPKGAKFMPLHVILCAWINARSCSEKEVALAGIVDPSHGRFKQLLAALKCFDKAEIALVNATSVKDENLPLLYDRIGAGGTPLNNEERLFSFYKYHRNDFHDIVRAVHQNSGRVMAPSKIAASAIRIANALAHQLRDDRNVAENRLPQPNEGNVLPEIAAFAKALEAKDGAQDGVNLQHSLTELLAPAKDGPANEGRFTRAFVALFKALKYDKACRPLGLPTVLLWRLPPNLVQVLLFWLLRVDDQNAKDSDDLIRFAMFWLLCSRSDDKVSSLCFSLIRQNKKISLRELCYNIRQTPALSTTLMTPDRMKEILVLKERSQSWRGLHDRIKDLEYQEAELIQRWWWDNSNFLPWLQRVYLAEAFLGFDPTADREDDTPYDVDHMVPYNDWRFNWGYRCLRLPDVDKTERARLRWIRDEIGNSIGNKWLVDYSFNRYWGDMGLARKLADVDDGSKQPLGLLLNVFPSDNRDLWGEASPRDWKKSVVGDPVERNELPWDGARRAKFQDVIEKRAAWLYGCLYKDLGFADWMEQATSE